jgi:hypothetical protein
LKYRGNLHVVMVIGALPLLMLDAVAELVRLDDDESPESIAPARKAIMKPVLGTLVPVKVDFI